MARKLLVKSLKELLENLPNVPIAEELFGNSNSVDEEIEAWLLRIKFFIIRQS